MGREAWSAMFVIFGLVDVGFLMTMDGAPAGSSPEASLAAPAVASAALSRPRRRAALFLAGTSQLITVQGASERRSHGRVPVVPSSPGASRLCAEEGVRR